MKVRVLFRIASRSLFAARRRTLMLSGALGLVSLWLVLLLSLSAGVTESLLRAATVLATGHINVAGFYKNKPGDSFPMISEVERLREIVRAWVPELDYMLDRGRGWGKLISETTSIQVVMAGVHAEEEGRLFDALQPANESEYKEGGGEQPVGDVRGLLQPNTVMLFAPQAKRLGVGVGDVLTVTTESITGRVNTAEVKVVAVMKGMGFMSNWNVFVPRDVLSELYQLNDDTSGAVMVYLKDRAHIPDVMHRLRTKLEEAGFLLMDHQATGYWMKFETVAGEDWTGQKLDLTSWEDEVSYMKWILTAIETISFFVVAILLAIVCVGIMNAMWMSVRERTREIGTLRAIGTGRRQIMALFVIEAFLLGLMATGGGGLLGALVAMVADVVAIPIPSVALRVVFMTDTLNLVVEPVQVVASTLFLSVMAALAAAVPAVRAARMSPVHALGHAG